MRYTESGRTGWNILVIGFGGWAIGGDVRGHQDDGDNLAALRRALEPHNLWWAD